jgi:putative endonuclease
MGDRQQAMAREKELKGWIRVRKIAMIEEHNPNWVDLAIDWYQSKQQDVISLS